MRRPAIVIVTFKRQELLANLFGSIERLAMAPWRVVVVDNEDSERTADLVAGFADRVRGLWGDTTDDPDEQGGISPRRQSMSPMSEISPTCPWRPAAICTWPR